MNSKLMLMSGIFTSSILCQTNYHSQIGQDKFLNEKIFHNKTNGVFVDIGAFDGITHSNTYFFETECAWTGICVEPLPRMYQKLIAYRNCICVNACVSSADGFVDFYQVDDAPEFQDRSDGPKMLSGMVSTYDPRHLKRLESECHKDGSTITLAQVQAVTFNTLMATHGIMTIDYISIDTEGSELEILKHIDFETIWIHALSVENNFNDPAISTFLESKGFAKRTDFPSGQDEIYINCSVKGN